MSVVNKMLQDLDARHAGEHQDAVYVPPPKRNMMPIALVLAVIVLAVLIYLAWFVPTGQVTGDSDETLTAQNQGAVPMTSDTGAVQAKPMQQINPVTEPQQQDTLVRESQPQSAVLVEPPPQPVIVQQLSEEAAQAPPSASKAEANSNAINVPSPPLPVNSSEVDALQGSSEPVSQATAADIQEPAPRGQLVMNTSKASEQTQRQRLQAEAQLALNENDLSVAMEKLARVLILAPDAHQVRQQLAGLYSKIGNHPRAVQILQAGVEQFPQQPKLILMLARALVNNGQAEQAVDLLNGQALSPNTEVERLALLAGLAQQTGQPQLAFDSYQALVKIAPDNSKWWMGLGISAEQLSLSATAVTAYQSALALNQLSPRLNQFVRQRLVMLGSN